MGGGKLGKTEAMLRQCIGMARKGMRCHFWTRTIRERQIARDLAVRLAEGDTGDGEIVFTSLEEADDKGLNIPSCKWPTW